MTILFGTRPADLPASLATAGAFRVTLTNEDTREQEILTVNADNAIRAKSAAQCCMTMRLMGATLSADVVRADA